MKRTYEEPMQLPKFENRVVPKGRFQLLGVDTFEGPFAEFVVGSFPTVEAGLAAGTIIKNGQSLMRYYVCDDKGKYIAEADPRDRDAGDPDARTLTLGRRLKVMRPKWHTRQHSRYLWFVSPATVYLG